MKRILWTISSILAALGIAAALLISLNLRGEEPLPAGETLQSTPELIKRGEYLARVGNCMADIARQLTPDDVSAVSAWLAAQPVAAGGKPARTLPAAMPARCGGVAEVPVVAAAAR